MQTTEISQSVFKKPIDTRLPTERYRSATHWYLSFLWRSPRLVFLSLGVSLFSAFLTLAPSLLLGMAFEFLAKESFTFTTDFLLICLAIVVTSILAFFVSFISNYSWTVAAFRYERDTRQEFFDIIQAHSMTFHDEIDSSSLLSMSMNEISQMRMGVNPSMRMLMNSLLSMTFIMFFFYFFDPTFLLLTLIGFPIYLILVIRYAGIVAPIRNELASRLAVVTRDSQEIFRGIEVVRSFNQEVRENKRFQKGSNRYAEMVAKEGRVSAFFWPALILIAITALIFGLGLSNINNSLDPSVAVGEFTASVSMLLSLQFLNFMLPMAIINIRAGKTNANRIWEKMSWKDPVPDIAPVDNEPNWNGDIIFENVNMKYAGSSKFALENINLNLPSGSRIAVIGGPGSGKSTFLKLLLRLYDPDEGKILLAGVPLTEISAHKIRRGVTMVEQEVFLFSASVKENIAFAKPGASDEEIILAAKNAQADTFIEKLPQGAETKIGERGAKLSGGQRQRIAIARALLADPKILLLDDSASAIDSKTELLLRRALDKLMENRTSIVVTQRLRTLIESDFVILFDKGKISAVGSHNDLLKDCEQYKRIFANLPEVIGGNF